MGRIFTLLTVGSLAACGGAPFSLANAFAPDAGGDAPQAVGDPTPDADVKQETGPTPVDAPTPTPDAALTADVSTPVPDVMTTPEAEPPPDWWSCSNCSVYTPPPFTASSTCTPIPSTSWGCYDPSTGGNVSVSSPSQFCIRTGPHADRTVQPVAIAASTPPECQCQETFTCACLLHYRPDACPAGSEYAYGGGCEDKSTPGAMYPYVLLTCVR